MWLLILLLVVVILVLTVIGLTIYARWNFGTLEKMGIPVVKPDHFLLGSATLTYEKPGGYVDIELMKKYGTVFGLYEGREPQVFICDPELIRLVTTKDADYFDGKRPLDFNDPLMNELPDFQPLEKWRIVRNMLSPVLMSTSRLRHANPLMRESVNDFVLSIKDKIKESNGKLENCCLTDEIYAMQTDLVARSQYSISFGKSSDTYNRFIKTIQKLMSPPANQWAALATWTYAFPFLKSILPNTMVNPEPTKEYKRIVKSLMETRRKETVKRPIKDLVDYCIEWYDNLDSEEYKQNNITENTVLAQGMVLFLGGQDQISLVLSVMVYFLSQNPSIERKVHAELDKVFANTNGIIDHDTIVLELPYLTACINEAIRLHPFFFRSERVCTKDWSNPERGIKIPKGTVIQISIWATHRNPDYFEDPESFKPERFMPGNKEKLHPYAFGSFGFGPRNCTGQRLAMETLVLISAYLLKEFRFLKRENTKLTFLPAGPFFGAHEPICFDVVERSSKSEE